MIEFGKTLRDAREAKGLTIAQVAEMTRMPSSRVEALETENFSGIPAAIYGRGFVRLYCEAVGLDPKPLAAEFTEIYSGNRDLEIRERAPAAAPAEPSADRPCAAPEPPAATPTPTAAETSTKEFKLESREVHSPVRHVPPPVSDPLRDAAPAERPLRATRPLSRYAAPAEPVHDTPRKPFSLPALAVPPAVWRIALLAAVGLLLLAGLCLGVRALYRAVNGADDAPPPTAPALAETDAPASKAQPAPKAGAPQPAPTREARTPQKIPALYID